MKTPREILFERHRSTEPKLDELRGQVVATVHEDRKMEALQGSRRQTTLGAALKNLWSELIWPSRRAWASLGAIWALVLVLNLGMKVESPATPAAGSARVGRIAQAFAERQRVLAELIRATSSTRLQSSASAPITPAPANSSGANPRSELRDSKSRQAAQSECAREWELSTFAFSDFRFVSDCELWISSFKTCPSPSLT